MDHKTIIENPGENEEYRILNIEEQKIEFF